MHWRDLSLLAFWGSYWSTCSIKSKQKYKSFVCVAFRYKSVIQRFVSRRIAFSTGPGHVSEKDWSQLWCWYLLSRPLSISVNSAEASIGLSSANSAGRSNSEIINSAEMSIWLKSHFTSMLRLWLDVPIWLVSQFDWTILFGLTFSSAIICKLSGSFNSAPFSAWLEASVRLQHLN